MVAPLKIWFFRQPFYILQDSFIVDNGQDGIWVWVGKRASKKEREEALRNAQGFISKKGYPAQ